MVSRKLAEKVFRKEAESCGFTEGAYLCFEEDCDAQVALRELMDKKLFQAPVNEHFSPGQYEAVINESVRTFHPEYWKVREKGMEGKIRQTKQRDKGNDR